MGKCIGVIEKQQNTQAKTLETSFTYIYIF